MTTIVENRRATFYFVLILGLFFVFFFRFAGAAQAADVPTETISAGYFHSCGVRLDGAIACWGKETTAPEGTFRQVSAGDSHTCAVKTDSTVVCWGDNTFGQATPPVGSFAQVSAGFRHTCAVKTDGTVVCWGANDTGEATPPMGLFKQVSAGNYHTCAVKIDDSVICWGWNNYGQAATPIGSFKQVSAGSYYSCGLKFDSTVACWGDNSNGKASPPTGVFIQVSAGNYHTCALKTDNSVACWGYNAYGQLNPPMGTFREISIKGYHSCGVKTDSTVACWGDDELGEASPPQGFIAKTEGMGPDAPMLSIDIGGRNLRNGQNIFTVPVHFLHNNESVSALDFALTYDQNCLSFDAITDSDNNGLPDALDNLPNGFDVGLENNSTNGTLKLVIKPPTSTPPLPILNDSDIARFTFGVQPSCVTNDGSPKMVNFTFTTHSFGSAQGISMAGNVTNGTYNLYFNVVPSAIALTSVAIDENLPSDTIVGTISSTPGDGETYTLVDGAGDNANFAISGNLLKTAASFNFESKNSYTVRIRTTDTYSNTFEKDFNITINNRNDAPVAHNDGTAPPLIVTGDGNPVTINVLANDTDEDTGDTLTVAAVTQGTHGATVQNNSNNVSYTAPTHYNGADSFSYTAQDQGGLTANATVSLYTIANDARGDCNGDNLINAADFPSLILEIFDTDVAQSWWRSAEQGFHGSPRGCDANATQNGPSHDQASVDAGDIICTVLVFFGHTSCTNSQVMAAHTGTSAMLSVASSPAAAPGQTVAVPLTLNTAGNRVAAATFALTFDPAYLRFDSSDANNDGVPDAILLNIPANLAVSANYNASQNRLEVALFSLALPMPLLTDGAFATITLHVTNTALVTTTPLTLSLVSLGDDQGQNVPVNAKDGLLQIGHSAFLPVIQR